MKHQKHNGGKLKEKLYIIMEISHVMCVINLDVRPIFNLDKANLKAQPTAVNITLNYGFTGMKCDEVENKYRAGLDVSFELFLKVAFRCRF